MSSNGIIVDVNQNSTWIEKNIISSTGFFGRISRKIKLRELSLYECNFFWREKKDLISSYEKFKILSITGGVPLYLEEVQLNLTAEQNIKKLCFTEGGLLFNDFEEIFTSLFYHKSRVYHDIVKILINGPKTLTQICKKLKKTKGGMFSEYLNDMASSGFISRNYRWDFKSGKTTRKIALYRISDNYLRFYLKYIEPNKSKIEEGEIKSLPPSWESILGLQFENLVLNNRLPLYKLLKIPLDEIINASPFLQMSTNKQEKCQIDLLIQTKFNNLYVCEIKFEKNQIQKSVVQEVRRKIKKLKVPRGFSIRPVLIHVNGIEDSVEYCDYFFEALSAEPERFPVLSSEQPRQLPRL